MSEDSADGLGFKLFDEQVGNNGADRGTHGCSIDVFIILTLEGEKGIFRQNSSNVVMCCMDMEVLFCSCVPCCNICLMLEMAGSTRTDVKRAFTSLDVVHSYCPNLMDLMWSTECWKCSDLMKKMPHQ